MFDTTCWAFGETTDVHFIHNGFGHGLFKGFVPFPVVGRCVDDDTAHAFVQVVAGDASGTSIPESQAVPFGIRVDEHLFGVEAMTVPGLVGPVNPIGVTHAWLDAFDEGMPDVETSV